MIRNTFKTLLPVNWFFVLVKTVIDVEHTLFYYSNKNNAYV